MFEQVIVGVDGLSGGRDALTLARQLAGKRGAIVLAHIYIETLPPARGSPGIVQAGERARSQELLESVRWESGVDARLCSIESPFVGRGLHELAERIDADLIVVGSSRRGLVGRVLQGDDMRAALNAAPCAVAIAPSGYAQRPALLVEIGVGYDGSPESRNALAFAHGLAVERHAHVSVFEAVVMSPPGGADVQHPDRNTLQAKVDQARERLASLGDVEPHAAYGDAAEELAMYGASVDLLIVGSRGYGPLGRLIHGRTSLRLAHTARCPLLVLPRGAPSDGTAAATERTQPQPPTGR